MEAEKFDCIYEKYRNMVLDVSYKVLEDFHLAQDVCQDVFIKLSPQRIEMLKDMERAKSYLLAITYHRAIDYRRMMEVREEKKLNIVKKAKSISDVENSFDVEQFLDKLFEGLKEKNGEWYQIVLRVGLYDEPQEIVARDMGISINLLRTKYHRAKKWIRRHYESDYDSIIHW